MKSPSAFHLEVKITRAYRAEAQDCLIDEILASQGMAPRKHSRFHRRRLPWSSPAPDLGRGLHHTMLGQAILHERGKIRQQAIRERNARKR